MDRGVFEYEYYCIEHENKKQSGRTGSFGPCPNVKYAKPHTQARLPVSRWREQGAGG